MSFYAPRKARRAAARLARPPSRRLLLERLEDRLVPSLADGTILGATFPSAFASGDQSAFPDGVVGGNPRTEAQASVSTGNLFALPTYFAGTPHPKPYVTDLQASRTR